MVMQIAIINRFCYCAMIEIRLYWISGQSSMMAYRSRQGLEI